MAAKSQEAALVALWLAAVPLYAGEPSPRPAASPAPQEERALAHPVRLNLGPFGPTVPTNEIHALAADVPRFSTEVEVRARLTDSAALTAKLAWWLRDFDGTRGPIRGAGRAPTLAEMRDFRPHPADSLDVGALVGWLVGKLK